MRPDVSNTSWPLAVICCAGPSLFVIRRSSRYFCDRLSQLYSTLKDTGRLRTQSRMTRDWIEQRKQAHWLTTD